MTRLQERRVQRVVGTSNDLMTESKWIIWCFEPKHMPQMIDLLIAEGRLAESDRQHCVHYTALKSPGTESDEEIAKGNDANEMLAKAGRAMLAWALIESELSTLFALLTGIRPDMAVKIFYAPRGFKGRTDIFKSALTVCKISEDLKTYTRSLIKKADHYSDCRNKFAHDQPLLHQQSFPAEFSIVLVDAKGQFQSGHERQRYIDESISTEGVAEIAAQFMNLANLIRDSWIEIQGSRSPSLETHRERLAALPNLPPKDRPPPTTKRGRQRPSSQE